jgi:protein-L-isoaspartate(D-aspartate) O-methyltransferase
MRHSIEEARQRYAEELRFTAKLGSRAVVEAFASVPREHFFGPGPWRVLSPMALGEYWTTEDADPRHLYHDVLVGDRRGAAPQQRTAQLLGSYVRPTRIEPWQPCRPCRGRQRLRQRNSRRNCRPCRTVIAIEIDPVLAARAKEDLPTAWPQTTVIAADGFLFQPDRPADAIIVNAGVTHFSSVWLDALASENGRLLVPLTNAEWWGYFLMITRQAGDPGRYAARFAGRAGMIPSVGGRDPAMEERLTAALARGDFTAIRSLRRAPEEPDHTCWLAGEGWWLSTAPASSGW